MSDDSWPETDRIATHIPSVVLVGNGLMGGGAENRLARLATELFSGSTDIITMTGNNRIPDNHHGRLLELEWHNRSSYPRMIIVLRQYLKRRRYDVIMSFGFFPIIMTALAMIGLKNRPKFILNEITRPIKAGMESRISRRIFYTLLRQVFYRQADLITANSIDGLKETCRLINVDVKYGIRLPNIIDSKLIDQKIESDRFAPIALGHYMVCMSRLVFMKRIDTVISAFHTLAPDIGCGLVIIGDGPARQILETQVHTLGLQESIIFTGMLENPLPILNKALAIILASEYEGFSNAILEAMFCDVPVITSFCSSDAHEMCGQSAALGFDVGNVAQLARHIAAIINDESLSQKLICRAREYRVPHALENALPVYEDLIFRVANHGKFSE